jgi:hypothetical protein
MEVEQAMCPGRGGGHGAGPRATLARWPCWEVENDLDVGSTCHRDKVRGKNIHSVGLEKQNVKESQNLLKRVKTPKSKKLVCPGLNFEISF